jgi:hypothetical protein
MLRFVGRSVLVAAVAAAAVISGPAQKNDKVKTKEGSFTCRNQNWDNDRTVSN